MLQRYSAVAYSLMRAVVGFTFACHGAQKLFGVLGQSADLHDPLGVTAGVIEFFGGGAISLGVGTSLAAFVASGEMAVETAELIQAAAVIAGAMAGQETSSRRGQMEAADMRTIARTAVELARLIAQEARKSQTG